MAKRHDDALTINCGACNPSGIALAIVEACREIRAEPGHTGTAQITSDPAVRLMVYQLAYICGLYSIDHDPLEFGRIFEACKQGGANNVAG